LRLVFPLNEEIVFSPRYSISQQEIKLPLSLRNCNNTDPTSANGTFPTDITTPNPGGSVFAPGGAQANDPGTGLPWTQNCFADGEASIPVKKELAAGPALTSAIGYSLTYNTLDNNKLPTSGMFVEFRQDLAGLGGDVNYIRSTIDARAYAEVLPDVVGFVRLQGGHIASWGGKDLRMLDHFQNSYQLVRGFASAGFGPRDLTCETAATSGATCDALGGSLYWGTTAEVQTPVYFLPKDSGVKLAAFVDAGSLWDYKGPTTFCPSAAGCAPGQTPNQLLSANLGNSSDMKIRAAGGVGLLWESPLGPIRFDFAFPFMKQSYDRTQWFRFSGGTSF
jgi:outer membrane protein insertion porin family